MFIGVFQRLCRPDFSDIFRSLIIFRCLCYYNTVLGWQSTVLSSRSWFTSRKRKNCSELLPISRAIPGYSLIIESQLSFSLEKLPKLMEISCTHFIWFKSINLKDWCYNDNYCEFSQSSSILHDIYRQQINYLVCFLTSFYKNSWMHKYSHKRIFDRRSFR
jgi:hypothetical protein